MRSGLDLANPLRASFGKIFQQNYKIMLLGIDAPGEICFAPMGIARKNWLGLLGGYEKKISIYQELTSYASNSRSFQIHISYTIVYDMCI